MSTLPTTINRSKREMIEVKAPELFQFTKPGQVLSGVYIAVEPVTVKGKSALEHMFEQPENKTRMSCLGTADLNKKLQAAHLGHWVDIRYESDQKLTNQPDDHSDMKIFKVLAGKTIDPGYEHLQAA